MTNEELHTMAAHLQDAFHFAAYAAGEFGRSTFSDSDIRSEIFARTSWTAREPTPRQLAVSALLRAGQCAIKAGTPAVAVGTAASWPLAKVRAKAVSLLAAVKAFAAQNGIDAYAGRVIETGVTGAPAGDGTELDEPVRCDVCHGPVRELEVGSGVWAHVTSDTFYAGTEMTHDASVTEQVKISNEIVSEIIAEERAEIEEPQTVKAPSLTEKPATKKVAIEQLVGGDVVVTSRTVAMLKVHSVAGMPGDYIILGERIDNNDDSQGHKEAWPARDLETVRILAPKLTVAEREGLVEARAHHNLPK